MKKGEIIYKSTERGGPNGKESGSKGSGKGSGKEGNEETRKDRREEEVIPTPSALVMGRGGTSFPSPHRRAIPDCHRVVCPLPSPLRRRLRFKMLILFFATGKVTVPGKDAVG